MTTEYAKGVLAGRDYECKRIFAILQTPAVLEQIFDKYLLDKNYSRDELVEDLIFTLSNDECTCDPCGDENCSCRRSRCNFCLSQD